MTLQSPKAVVFEGRGGGVTAQVTARARKKARVLSVTTTTGNVILPVSSNSRPFAVYEVTNLGTDAVYWALGTTDAIAATTAANGFDGAIPGGAAADVCNDDTAVATHIAGITAAGAATLVIVGRV